MIEVIMGLAFMVVGIVFALIFALLSGDVLFGLIGCVFGVVFCAVGGKMMLTAVKQIKRDKETEKYGMLRIGKIVDYRDSNVYKNDTQ